MSEEVFKKSFENLFQSQERIIFEINEITNILKLE
jgi:hypothetical protein